MEIYKHITYNPRLQNISTIIQEAQDSSNLESGKEWQFVRTQPITEYEWVAIFEKWQNEVSGTPVQPMREQIYLQAIELSRGHNQVVGNKSDNYITLEQLQMILEKF